MNDTVAVALITALSTLAAAGLAALVSARSTARQLRHQADLAREERAEQRAAARREARSQAYEQFLGGVDAAYRVLDEGWTARPFAEPLPWQAGFTARRTVDEALVRVQLTGPDAVAEAGRAVVRSLAEEFRVHAGVVGGSGHGHPGGRAGSLGLPEGRAETAEDLRTEPSSDGTRDPELFSSAVELAPRERAAALSERFATSRRFVAAARAALDGDGHDDGDVGGSDQRVAPGHTAPDTAPEAAPNTAPHSCPNSS